MHTQETIERTKEINKRITIAALTHDCIDYDRIEREEHNWLLSFADAMIEAGETGRHLSPEGLTNMGTLLRGKLIAHHEADLRENRRHNGIRRITQIENVILDDLIDRYPLEKMIRELEAELLPLTAA